MAKKSDKTVKTPIQDPILDEVLDSVEVLNEFEETPEEAPAEAPAEEPVVDECPLYEPAPVVEETPEESVHEEVDELDPLKVIEEFSEASKELDKKITANLNEEEIEKVLTDELNRVEEIESTLEQQIKTKMDNITQSQKGWFTNFWGGVNSGWFE
jgi:hypothetical protein